MGKRIMNLYFDTEFTGLKKSTQLISLGIIYENGRTFYAEFNDYNPNECDEWIQKNVIEKLTLSDKNYFWKIDESDGSTICKGSKQYVRAHLEYWLSAYDNIQLVSDVCHYDMVLFVDLFGTAFDLPASINPSCHDINQDIAKYFNISERKAFDVSRAEMTLVELKDSDEQHNSLYDAKVIKAIYEKIHGKIE